MYNIGMLPDPSGGDKCKVQHGPNGKLLSKVTITTQQELDQVKPVRIFCGTYTMEKNHKNNVATLRNTWGKRCDGWVAFSTKADPSIPAISIEHEGEESYDYEAPAFRQPSSVGGAQQGVYVDRTPVPFREKKTK